MTDDRAEETAEPPKPTSMLPWAMAAAFLGGAGIAGYLIFGDQIGQWTTAADLTWQLQEATPLTVEAQQRTTIRRSTGPVEIRDVSSTWLVEPVADSRFPGGTVVWQQMLRRGRYRAMLGTEVKLDAPYPLPPDTVPAPRPEGTPRTRDEGRAELFALLVGVPLTVTLEPDITLSTADAAHEEVESIARSWYQPDPDPRDPPDPLPEGAMDQIQLALDDQLGRVLRSVGPASYDRSLRPGQTWSAVYPVEIPPWGEHDVKYDLRVERVRDDAPVAEITATLSRRPRAGESLGAGDALSGLKGTGLYRFDLAQHRPLNGVTRIEASGKIDRQFAKVSMREAFAVTDSADTVEIPADLLVDPPAPVEATPQPTDAEVGGPQARPPLTPPEE